MESRVPKPEEETLAYRTIIIIGVVTIALVLLSIVAMSSILNDFYSGSYYTVAVIFDAVGFYPDISAVQVFGSQFYQFFSVMLLDGIVKMVILGFLFAAVIELVSGINIKSRLSIITARRLRDHIILCGYSKFAERLAKDLSKEGKSFVIIEREKNKVEMLRNAGYLAIEGDFTKEPFLHEASIKNAKAVVFDSSSDFEDALSIIAIKRINPSVKVIVRLNSENSIINMVKAGADQCVIPEILAGAELGAQITRIL